MGITDFRPFTRIRLDGEPLSNFLFSKLSSVRVTDVAGYESDTADIVFDNGSLLKRLQMPDPGAEVEVELGYLGKFKHMGLYVADEVEESSPPREISVMCRAKAQGATQGGLAPIHQQKTRTWAEGLSISDIAAKIAADNGLDPGVTDEAAQIVPGHIDQIDESDLSVLTRLAYAHDLVAKPAGGVLFIGRKAAGVKASGGSTPTIALLEAHVTRWGMRKSLSEATGTVIATYRDITAGQDIEVKVGEDEPVRRLRQRFRTKAEAETAANAEFRRASRAKETLELELPGNPNIVAEGRIEPLDFSSAAAGLWVVETCTHELDQDGYRTTVSAQRSE